jgi:hypothetical protein
VLPQHQVGTTISNQGIFLGLSKLKFLCPENNLSHVIAGSNDRKTARNFYEARLAILKIPSGNNGHCSQKKSPLHTRICDRMARAILGKGKHDGLQQRGDISIWAGRQ